jgi:hypothetical protein
MSMNQIKTVLMGRFAMAALVAAAPIPVMGASSEKVHVADGVDYTVPLNSPVKFASTGQYDVASFSGRFLMSGSYHYGYITNDRRAEDYGDLELYFLPDNRLAMRLPYWAQRHPVREVRFRNERAFVMAVVPSKERDALKRRKILSTSGRATVVVEAYQASIECDYPTYSVMFVSIEHSAQWLASSGPVQQFGC